MEIAAVTDEISLDLEEAFKVGTELGINKFELRRLWSKDKRVPNLTEEEISKLETLIDKYNVDITALSPGIFKVPLSDPKIEYHREELLEDTFQLGNRLGVNKIIIFGIRRAESDQPEDINQVIKYMNDLVTKAEEEDFEIWLENEPGWWADTAENTRYILETVDSPNFKLNWDPGNSIRTAVTPYPDEYEVIKDYIGNVHFKDAVVLSDGYKCCTADIGDVNWEGQIKALYEDDYQGIITIETHCRPLIEKARIDYKILNDLISKN
ncbi:sugar phosphate isomerase/epimerase [Halanaerocella petrolearia]